MKTAVILAAGMGKRLKLDTPKSLLKIGNKTLLEHSIHNLKKCGIKNIIVVIGYKEAMMRNEIKHIAKKEKIDIKCVVNGYYDFTGNGYSLLCGIEHIEEPFIYLDADILYDHRMVCEMLKSEHKNMAIYASLENDSGEEVKVYGDKKRITDIGKEVNTELKPLGEAIGIYKITDFKEAKQMLKSMSKNNEHEDFINDFCKRKSVIGLKTNYCWIEIDFPADIKRAKCVYDSLMDM